MTDQKTSEHDEKPPGLVFPRTFTSDDTPVDDAFEWTTRDAAITNGDGAVVFSQNAIRCPAEWSDRALNIVAEKYFRGAVDDPERESSIGSMVHRVVDQIACWGKTDGYFRTDADREAFRDELTYLMLSQRASFNSPVWFNGGTEEHPQMSACFINGVEDTMTSILDLAKTEGMLFKHGSGTGTNLSPLRSRNEHLHKGGTASGPVSFMRGFDAFAGVIKSGGSTRRAAKMVLLNADHPDIIEFIDCKARDEEKAWALIDAGYDGSFDGVAYSSISFQNANNSVRVDNAFMEAVTGNTPEERTWRTRKVLTGEIADTLDAREMLERIAAATHLCGDPGLQFDTTVNKWHTCPNTDRIHASNPCAEYMFLNDSACNLASINLLKFLEPGKQFDTESFRATVRTMILAQEIIVGNAGYPTPKIAKNSAEYRPLGLGYANLGSLLMGLGLPYDSDEGRLTAAALAALMTGEAYAMSAQVSRDHGGPFKGFSPNREPFLDVMRMHQAAAKEIAASDGNSDAKRIAALAAVVWTETVKDGTCYGFRNAQATVIAPTGTISLMMDCDTTGIEPEFALVKYKNLVGGGVLKMLNGTIEPALRALRYSSDEIQGIAAHIKKTGAAEGAPRLHPAHEPVFDCATKPARGVRAIRPEGHIRMVSAVQPFISGAISKTINMPREATVDEILNTYIDAWRAGMKAVSVYRDGSKRTQPLVTHQGDATAGTGRSSVSNTARKPMRRKLPDERRAITHKFDIAGHKGYVTVGLYPDGTPGEMFLTMAKEGSTISGFADAFAQAVSYALQYGVPLKILTDKFSHVRFEPAGRTRDRRVPIAKSIVDYVFRWMASKFLSRADQLEAGVTPEPASAAEMKVLADTAGEPPPPQTISNDLDAPACAMCGAIMIRNGTCYLCTNCGATSGCS